MNPENERTQQLVAARLAELRSAMQGESAPARVERQVMAAFRASARGSHAHRRWFLYPAVAASCVAIIAGVYAWQLRRTVPKPPAPIAAAIRPAPLLAHTAEPVNAKAVRPTARVRTNRAHPAAKPRAPQAAEEFATDFLPLPYAPPLGDGAAAQVVRVRLPRSAMRTVGLAFDEHRALERVPADVLLGEDGLARAVRFVRDAR